MSKQVARGGGVSSCLILCFYIQRAGFLENMRSITPGYQTPRVMSVEVTLLRYTKYCAMGLFLFAVLCTLSVSPSYAAVQAVQTYADSTWSNTIYYLGTVSGYYGQTQTYQDITIHITAVDEYELYVNGTAYTAGNDHNFRTVDDYSINVGGAKVLNIGVKVTNNGTGNGNGLIVGIDAGTDQLGTSTRIRESMQVQQSWLNIPVSWWSFDEAGKTSLGFGATWYNFDGTKLFNENNKTKFMRRAMNGTIKADLDYTFPQGVEAITGYLQTNVDTGATVNGGIKLRRIEGENIALGKAAEIIELTDGDLQVAKLISSPLNQTRYVDLGRIYSVNKMTIFTGGQDVNKYLTTSLRGYSVEVSLDEYRYEEVGVIHEIGLSNPDKGGYDNYSVEFPEEWARFIRFKITEARNVEPEIGEVMVFGVGYVLTAYYDSPWLDFGSPTSFKNFNEVTWDGTIPSGTKITVQTRTKTGATATPSSWSSPMEVKNFQFGSPEPATHFQYRVNLSTQDLNSTPVFKKFSVEYSNTNQPVTACDGYVTPNAVPMDKETRFLYSLSYQLAAGQNIGELAIAVPSYSTLNYVYSSDTKDTLDVTVRSTIDTLYVSFSPALTNVTAGGADTLYVSFNSSLLRSAHRFDAFLFNSTGNDGAGGVKAWENISLGSNMVTVSQLVDSIITDVTAAPKVFTPNSDGMNDFTVIEFRLAKVQTNIMVNIYSTDGTLVTTVYDDILPPSNYSAPGDMATAKTLPGAWDGTDQDGDMVPPGIYIYQVIAETDDEDIVESGTVVLAY